MSQQQEVYYRPPTEADSFIIRVMHGCPHNECTFCNLFKTVPFRPVPLADVLSGIDSDAEDLGEAHRPKLTSMYLEGGDPLALRSESLLAIMEHAKSRFPNLGRFACYATARFGIQKKQEELNALGRAGLRRVFVGLESGSDTILQATNKGCTSDDLKRFGEKLFLAGIEMDVSMMLGIGGQALSREHAVKTAELLSAINPVCVRIRTFVAKHDTPLGDEYLEGRFELMDPHDILRELRLMVEHTTGRMQLLSEHWSDFIHFAADLPGAREALLDYIDQALAQPRESFRPVGIDDERA